MAKKKDNQELIQFVVIIFSILDELVRGEDNNYFAKRKKIKKMLL